VRGWLGGAHLLGEGAGYGGPDLAGFWRLTGSAPAPARTMTSLAMTIVVGVVFFALGHPLGTVR
jgi:hypothetical protein